MFNVSANRVFSLLDTTEFSKETFGKKHLAKVHGDFESKMYVLVMIVKIKF